ncbi:100k [Murine adenovirus 3]|uniref:100k n=1 Tax=Murine adenovirus 3 TaxID=573199 RepID=C3SAV0_9ADEN|nr:100k [Murine adenovirus 3]ACJ14520.1 100k [Murine adenovirus 3]
MSEVTDKHDEAEASKDPVSGSSYMSAECLLTHIHRQGRILREALNADTGNSEWDPTCVSNLLEKSLFTRSCKDTAKIQKQANGAMNPDPRLNFYPAFMVPEVLATYHPFFINHRIPISCRANRPHADKKWHLRDGAGLPDIVTVQEQPRFFESLREADAPQTTASVPESEGDGALIELAGDSPRLAVMKRCLSVTHAAYPAIGLPPKITKVIAEELVYGRENVGSEPEPPVTDDLLQKWLQAKDAKDPAVEEQRKTVTAVALITCQLEVLRSFFSRQDIIRRVGESLHYLFHHGYVKQAIDVSQTDLTHLVTYMGVIHENRVGQSVLHRTLSGEARRDYIRDTIYLFLIYTWQTAMGVWQQCLEESNLSQLRAILHKHLRSLYTERCERILAAELRRLVFPSRLEDSLAQGLPDILHQSIIHNFRSFILERSGILPATSCAFPSDFVPTCFRECPPPLWAHAYLLSLANYFMYHNDLQEDLSGEGLLTAHCRCNLCSPHRSLVLNSALLNEVKCINTFELQGPPDKDGKPSTSFKLTPGLWVSAYLRKFEAKDYHPFVIKYFENSNRQSETPLTACVITQPQIVAQLLAIHDHRREFLKKKGKGVYLDPQTGEELSVGGVDAHFLSDGRKNAKPRENNHTIYGGRRGRVDDGRGQRGERHESTELAGGRRTDSSSANCPKTARGNSKAEERFPELECDCGKLHGEEDPSKMGLSPSTEQVG